MMILSILFLWFYVLVIAKGENCCKQFEYLECVPNKALVGHVIRTLKVQASGGLDQCQAKCFAEPEDRCISYNLGPVEGHVRTCELNRFDHLTSPDLLKPMEKAGHHYCPIKNACSSNPCQNSGKLCVPDFYWDSFTCVSPIMWTAWGALTSHCSLPRVKRRSCVNALTQANSSACAGKEVQQIPQSKACSIHLSLGVQNRYVIPWDNFRASSYAGDACRPVMARLSNDGWCAAHRQSGESVWVDLNAVKTVTKIHMKGREGNDQWPTEFTLAFRTTTTGLCTDYVGGPEQSTCVGPMTFFHNVTSRYEMITTNLPWPIIARQVKIIVVKYHDNPSLRFALNGC